MKLLFFSMLQNTLKMLWIRGVNSYLFGGARAPPMKRLSNLKTSLNFCFHFRDFKWSYAFQQV